MRQELENLLGTISRLNLTPKDFQKVHTSSGTWFVSIDVTRTACLVLVNPSYPVNSAVRFQREFQSEVQRIPRYFDPDTNLYDILKFTIFNMMKHYDADSDFNDKLHTSKATVDGVTNLMKDNLKKAVENTDHLNILSDRTDDLMRNSIRFRDDAKELRVKMQKKRIMVIAMIACVTVAFFGMIFYSFGKSD